MMRKGRVAAVLGLLGVLAALPVWAAPQPFLERAIDSSLRWANCIHAADVDGDGDTDVVGGSSEVDAVAWWENDGGSPPEWRQRRIGGLDDPYSCYATDLDGDGDIDVLGAGYEADAITWWENDGRSPPGWRRRNVETHFEGASSVYAADVDGDGNTDVLGTDMDGDHVTYWENDGGHPPGWTRHDIDDSFGGGYSVYASDLDADGDMDVLAATTLGDMIGWWENDGGRPPGWTKHLMGSFGGASAVYAADLDGDGDVDILGAAPSVRDIAWWQNDGASPPGWTKYLLETDFDAISMSGSDVDGDGDVDVVGASTNRGVAWWENDGASMTLWTRHDVDNDFEGACSIHAIDVDSDCDIDILGVSWSRSQAQNALSWWENLTMQFAMAPAAATKRVASGESVTVGISVEGEGDCLGPVTLHAGGLPPGGTATFAPNPVLSPGESLMTVNTNASTPSGTYLLEIVGTSDEGCYRRTTVVLEVAEAEFVPEPATALMLGVGLAGLLSYASVRRLRE
jgi:hypothetical protein